MVAHQHMQHNMADTAEIAGAPAQPDAAEHAPAPQLDSEEFAEALFPDNAPGAKQQPSEAQNFATAGGTEAPLAAAETDAAAAQHCFEDLLQ